MEHSSIGMTPVEALKEKNNHKVKMKMATEATRTCKYPELDKVKIYRKKGVAIGYLQNINVKGLKKLGQPYFYLDHNTRPFLRIDISKV